MKYFNVHYNDKKVERIKGESIQDAFKKAGLGGGIMGAVDYWEEVTEVPAEQKTIHINNDEICNPTFIEQLRNFLKDNPIGGTVQVHFANRIYEYVLLKQTGTEAFFC